MKVRQKQGFTLIEMLFVVFLITIMCSLAAPGIKRQIKDARLKEFTADFLELIHSFRAYYLIYNE